MSRRELEIDMEDTQKFLSFDPNDPKVKIEDAKKQSFNGLSKEQIELYANDPKWVKVRWILFASFWIIWIGMLVGAVLIVYFTPKCAFRPKQSFWDKEVVYQLDVEKFKDSNGDEKGDIGGLIQELDYFDKIGVKTLLLDKNILTTPESEEANALNPVYGNNADLKALRKMLNDKDMFLVFDVPVGFYIQKSDLVGNLLKDYADGIRIILDNQKLDENQNATIKTAIDNVKKISKDTFKPKFIAFHPLNVDFEQSNLIDTSLLNIDEATIKDAKKFVEKIKNVYSKSGESPIFLLGEFSQERIKDKIPDTSKSYLYQSIALLLKGTPFMLYGDEIEFTKNDEYMKWDNSNDNCGFSSNSTKVINCDINVKKLITRGETLPRILNKLNKLRRNPSFSWGKITFPDNEASNDNLISFLREADGFDSYLVAANTGNNEFSVNFQKKFKSLENVEFEQATIEYFYSADPANRNDFAVKDNIHLNNIYLKHGELIVIRYGSK